MAKILIAKPVTKNIYAQLKEEIAQSALNPQLAIIFIGNDPAAEWYVNSLQKNGVRYGIEVNVINFPYQVEQNKIEDLLRRLNNDDSISGIMVQKPLPAQLDENKINTLIQPGKDVDGFNPYNLGKLLLEQPALKPCTPQAVMKLLEFYEIETSGKRVVILGRSNIVGKPLSLMLMSKSNGGNATVTVCHSMTRELGSITREADILIAAIGRAHYVKADGVKENAVVIDVGTNLISDPEKGDIYVGDVEFEKVQIKASAITPVPGGVGSITTALLLKNVVIAAKWQKNK
jgi:methylenetetrahydrofolate dehydrogenase (NADP+) / methenyltetrahydrofolate cyclohydrolase